MVEDGSPHRTILARPLPYGLYERQRSDFLREALLAMTPVPEPLAEPETRITNLAFTNVSARDTASRALTKGEGQILHVAEHVIGFGDGAIAVEVVDLGVLDSEVHCVMEEADLNVAKPWLLELADEGGGLVLGDGDTSGG